MSKKITLLPTTSRSDDEELLNRFSPSKHLKVQRGSGIVKKDEITPFPSNLKSNEWDEPITIHTRTKSYTITPRVLMNHSLYFRKLFVAGVPVNKVLVSFEDYDFFDDIVKFMEGNGRLHPQYPSPDDSESVANLVKVGAVAKKLEITQLERLVARCLDRPTGDFRQLNIPAIMGYQLYRQKLLLHVTDKFSENMRPPNAISFCGHCSLDNFGVMMLLYSKKVRNRQHKPDVKQYITTYKLYNKDFTGTQVERRLKNFKYEDAHFAVEMNRENLNYWNIKPPQDCTVYYYHVTEPDHIFRKYNKFMFFLHYPAKYWVLGKVINKRVSADAKGHSKPVEEVRTLANLREFTCDKDQTVYFEFNRLHKMTEFCICSLEPFSLTTVRYTSSIEKPSIMSITDNNNIHYASSHRNFLTFDTCIMRIGGREVTNTLTTSSLKYAEIIRFKSEGHLSIKLFQPHVFNKCILHLDNKHNYCYSFVIYAYGAPTGTQVPYYTELKRYENATGKVEYIFNELVVEEFIVKPIKVALRGNSDNFAQFLISQNDKAFRVRGFEAFGPDSTRESSDEEMKDYSRATSSSM